ncbi:Hypothetical protein CAP_1228 [Chondromyces apiculatus DSM 436]|uniref:Uncharacterized protein n=2 Tax=Chondromyces apiculatus TaxID=51 RepID=A0A017TCJ3_9BACT|nr:Hypothetical protein CAP_1228 [Chondromyces apiculatus DSM 436]
MQVRACLLALCGIALVGLAPASCVLDVEGTASETTASSGSAGEGGTGAAGGGGGGTSGTAEDCLDGIDNDGDRLTDCEDEEDCAPAAYECVPAAPEGWTGNVRAAVVPTGDAGSLPECPPGTTAEDHHATPATAPDCSTCACDWDDDQARCSPPQVTCWWGNTSCGGTSFEVFNDLVDNTCRGVNYPMPGGSCQRTGPGVVTNPGTCAPAPGAGELQTQAPFAEAARLCTSPGGGGCTDGQVCVPRAATGNADVDARVCITQEGTGACPSGWTDAEIQLYADGADSRACSPCVCGEVTCTGGFAFAYDSDDCNVVFGVLPIIQFCSDQSSYIDNNQFSVRGTAATPQPPSCDGGLGSGTVEPEGPTKLCCHQQVP